MSKELRFEGRDIIFPKWLRAWGFVDCNKDENGAAVAMRLLPNKKLLVMLVYPTDVSQRPDRDTPRFQLELSENGDSENQRLCLGSGGMPHILSRAIAYAIKKNPAGRFDTEQLRRRMRVYNDANGAGTIVEMLNQDDGRFCRVRWDLNGKTSIVSEGSCDRLEPHQPQEEKAA